MTPFGRRLTALETVAEEVRARPFRELAFELGIPVADVMASYAEAAAEIASLRARGYSEREVIEALAAEICCTVDELRAETAQLARRFDLLP